GRGPPNASTATRVRGAGPLRQRVARRVAGRVLLVGDAGGYIDALTGEGISLGRAQARAAVSAVRADRPHTYERAWRQASWRYAAMTHALVQATRPAWARQAIVPAAAALPTVFRAAVRELGRSNTCTSPPVRRQRGGPLGCCFATGRPGSWSLSPCSGSG